MRESGAFLLGMLAMGVMLVVPTFAFGATPSDFPGHVMRWIGAAGDAPAESALLDGLRQESFLATPTAVPAPYCPPGEAPRFVLGFAELKHELGEVMGEPVECEHTNPDNGDTVQLTSTGLAVYSPTDGQLRFTNGAQTWRLTGRGLEQVNAG